MKRLSILVLAVLLALFVGCSKEDGQTMSSIEAVTSESKVINEVETVKEDDSPYDDSYQRVVVAGETVLWDGYRAIEPESNLDIWSMKLSDFGDFFPDSFEVSRNSYKLMEGSVMETEVLHMHSANEGPSVYIVGAVHGDERAAWYAALLTRQATISCGDLYILVPANANGARNNTRYVVERQDLNRSFPGDPGGNQAEQLAAAIFSDIADKRPSLVLDLHEAIVMNQSRDFLGSTYIFTKLDGMEDLFFDLVFSTQDGTICHNEFSVTGPGPDGSVNSTVTNLLHIPTITVETFRGFRMERRVQDQLDTIQYVLNYLGML